MTVADGALLAAASAVAGAVNAIAGGGTLLTFPALLAAGVPPVTANATNTVALFPGQISSSLAYRGHIADERRRAIVLAVPSLLGGILGAWLLLALPEKTFAVVVPWLIVFACVVLAFQGQLRYVVARVKAAMNPKPHTVAADAPISEVAKLLHDRKLNGVIVVNDKGDLAGLLTTTNALEALIWFTQLASK